jgi:hypothetical protein
MPLLTAVVLAAAGHSVSANNYLSYTNDISVQTVLTQDRPDWCRGRKLMFDIDGLQRAYYGCWNDSQGFAHILMVDGSQRIMPITQFSKLTGDGR